MQSKCKQQDTCVRKTLRGRLLHTNMSAERQALWDKPPSNLQMIRTWGSSYDPDGYSGSCARVYSNALLLSDNITACVPSHVSVTFACSRAYQYQAYASVILFFLNLVQFLQNFFFFFFLLYPMACGSNIVRSLYAV